MLHVARTCGVYLTSASSNCCNDRFECEFATAFIASTCTCTPRNLRWASCSRARVAELRAWVGHARSRRAVRCRPMRRRSSTTSTAVSGCTPHRPEAVLAAHTNERHAAVHTTNTKRSWRGHENQRRDSARWRSSTTNATTDHWRVRVRDLEGEALPERRHDEPHSSS